MVRSRLIRTWGQAAAGIGALVATAVVPSGCGSADPAPPADPPQLNAYCDDHGATAQLSGRRTVYCTPVQGTDAYVWAYTRDPLRHDPNTRGYTCDANGCHFPDGSAVPNYLRCGILCGEPPTGGDVQSGFADCFHADTPVEECERRMQSGH